MSVRMNPVQKIASLCGMDFVALQDMDFELNVRRVDWVDGHPFARRLVVTGLTELLPGGGVQGGPGFVKHYFPLTERIKNWSEVTAACLGEPAKAKGATYVVGQIPNGTAWIQCLRCNHVSCDPGDIFNLYCGLCKAFHDRP